MLVRRVARWSLLVAALLQFGAAAVGPYWHLTPLAFPAAALQVPEGGEAPAPSAPHDEQACIVCQSLGSVGALPAPSVLPFSSVVSAGEVPRHPLALRDLARRSTQARAPPSA